METKEKVARSLWDSAAVVDHLQIPLATLNQWAHRGIGPRYIKVGRHRRYRPEDVEAWLDRQRQGGDAA